MAVNFKGDYKYTNIGNIVGTLCYVKPLLRKDGSQYGGEFLINVKGHGAINVRVPSVAKVNEITAEFNPSDRPKVRVPLTQVDCYFAQSGKTYINFTTFAKFVEAKENAEDTAKGNLTGEVIKFKEENGKLSVLLAVFNVDKEGNRITTRDGKPLDGKVMLLEIVDKALINQFNNEVQVGSNVAFGYSYINKNEVSYDEFGLPIGDGGRITRIEVGKIMVHKGKKEAPKPAPVVEDDPFTGGIEVDPFAFDVNDDDIPF